MKKESFLPIQACSKPKELGKIAIREYITNKSILRILFVQIIIFHTHVNAAPISIS